MELKRRPGNVFLSPQGQPAPKPTQRNLSGSRPSWGFDTEDNYTAWWDIFKEMAMATREHKRQRSTAQDITHSQQLRDAVGYPVNAVISHDEVIIGMSDDSRIKVAVRDLPGGSYELMNPPQKLWDLAKVHRKQVRALGFRPVKQRGRWYIRYRPQVEDN